ncbi:MAG: hypothetical protein ACTSRE_16900 [Promethearchaeota archaeon]
MNEDRPNAKNRITPGPFSTVCKICSTELKPKDSHRCLYCDKLICKECMEYGICSDHYQVLEESDKLIFNKKYRSNKNYVLYVIILMVVAFVPYLFLQFDIDFGLGLWFYIGIIALEVSGGVLFLVIIIIMTHYRKKVKPSLFEIVRKYENKDNL